MEKLSDSTHTTDTRLDWPTLKYPGNHGICWVMPWQGSLIHPLYRSLIWNQASRDFEQILKHLGKNCQIIRQFYHVWRPFIFDETSVEVTFVTGGVKVSERITGKYLHLCLGMNHHKTPNIWFFKRRKWFHTEKKVDNLSSQKSNRLSIDFFQCNKQVKVRILPYDSVFITYCL